MAYFMRRRRGARHQWLLGIAIIALATWVAWTTSGTRSAGPAQLSPQEKAMSEHCAEYVTLAKTNFGANWKARLPAGGPCAKAIEQAWEREQAAPATAAPPTAPVAPPIAPAPIEPYAPSPLDNAPPPEFAAAPAESAPKAKAEPRGGLDTYCLNVVGLARTKYGDDWKANLTPREASRCAAYGRRLR